MKNFKKLVLPALAMALALVFASCNQEDINTSRVGVTDEELNQGGLAYGLAMMSLQRSVMPIGVAGETGPGNSMQVLELISTGNYVGYYGIITTGTLTRKVPGRSPMDV